MMRCSSLFNFLKGITWKKHVFKYRLQRVLYSLFVFYLENIFRFLSAQDFLILSLVVAISTLSVLFIVGSNIEMRNFGTHNQGLNTLKIFGFIYAISSVRDCGWQ